MTYVVECEEETPEVEKHADEEEGVGEFLEGGELDKRTRLARWETAFEKDYSGDTGAQCEKPQDTDSPSESYSRQELLDNDRVY